MSQFTTARLAGQRVLVRGTDDSGGKGETVLSSAQWDSIKAASQVDEATVEFDAAVEAFFKPLTDAVEKVQRKAERKKDPSSYVVIGDEVEHVEGQRAHVEELNHDSQVLRLIEEGNSHRLIWVGEGLEILEYQPQQRDAEPFGPENPGRQPAEADATTE